MINEHTDRMHLKRFNKNHGNLIYQLDSDPDVMKYITLGVPRNEIEVMESILEEIMPYSISLNVPLGIEIKKGISWGSLS